MQGSLEQPPITLQAKRKRGVPILILGLLATFGGALLVAAPRSGSLGPFGLFAAGLFLVFLGLLMVAAPTELILEPAGIRLKGALRTRSFAWDQVANFRVVRLRRTELIGFDRPGQAGGRSLMRDLGMAMTTVNISGPYDAVLPGGWSIASAATVAEIMNQARAQWGGALAARVPDVRRRGSSGQRIDRRLYWMAVCTLGPLAVLLSLATHGARGLSGGFGLIWIWVYMRRLHDIGRSGWWQAPVFGVQCVVAVVLMTSLHASAPAVLAAVLLIQGAFTAILGAIPGDPGENRFGAPPGVPLAEVQAEAFR